MGKNNGWTKDNEYRCRYIGMKAAAFNWLHNQTAQKYEKINRVFLFISLIGGYVFGTTGTGTAALSTYFNDTNTLSIATIIINILVFVLGIIATIHTFLKYDEKIGKQRWASSKNISLYLDIKNELSKSRKARHDYQKFFKNLSRLEYEIKNEAPTIPGGIIEEYYELFKLKAINQEDLFDLGNSIVIAPIEDDSPKSKKNDSSSTESSSSESDKKDKIKDKNKDKTKDKGKEKDTEKQKHKDKQLEKEKQKELERLEENKRRNLRRASSVKIASANNLRSLNNIKSTNNIRDNYNKSQTSSIGFNKFKSKKDYPTFKGSKLNNKQRYELEKYFDI